MRIDSTFGKLTLASDQRPCRFPIGKRSTGYEVSDLTATLNTAKAAGVTVLVEPYEADGRDAMMVQFPGGYIAEIHAVAPR